MSDLILIRAKDTDPVGKTGYFYDPHSFEQLRELGPIEKVNRFGEFEGEGFAGVKATAEAPVYQIAGANYQARNVVIAFAGSLREYEADRHSPDSLAGEGVSEAGGIEGDPSGHAAGE